MQLLVRHKYLISTSSYCFSLSRRQTHLRPVVQQQKQLVKAFTSESSEGNFTLWYLINSCNLSPAWALKLCKRVKLKSPEQPNAVLSLLRTFGFSEPQLSLLVKRFPLVLKTNPHKTLSPKLRFFQSIGLSPSDLPKLLIGNSVLLEGSLNNCILPRYRLLQSVLRHDALVATALKRVPWCLTGRALLHHLLPNVDYLRRAGVPQGSITHAVCNNLAVTCVEHVKFVKAVDKVLELGFDPKKVVFVEAVKVVVGTSKEVWEKRLEVYSQWGWSFDMCLSAFKRYPQCMLMSESKVMRTMSFLVKDMGWPVEDVFRAPGILSPNLEKTIMPRCRVVKALKERELVKTDLRLSSVVLITEKVFLERFVSRFQDRVSGLMEVYRGHIDHLDVVL